MAGISIPSIVKQADNFGPRLKAFPSRFEKSGNISGWKYTQLASFCGSQICFQARARFILATLSDDSATTTQDTSHAGYEPGLDLDPFLTDDQPESWDHLGHSYITTAAVGRVECNSKGCRPILSDSQSSRLETAENGSSATASLKSWKADHVEHLKKLATGSPDEMIWNSVTDARDWFETALLFSPHDSQLLNVYAQFAWKEMHDLKKAEALFKAAVDVSPDNAEALASFALFLWEVDTLKN